MPKKVIDNIVSPYLSKFLHPPTLKILVRRAIKQIPPVKYDSVAFRGMSGAMIAPLLATKLNKNLIMVRKETEISHSCHLVEGFQKSKSYIIVDDFIESGKTVFDIYFKVQKFAPTAKFQGVLVVADGSMRRTAEFIPFGSMKECYSKAWRVSNRKYIKTPINKQSKKKKIYKS